jgi:hypothetical protein
MAPYQLQHYFSPLALFHKAMDNDVLWLHINFSITSALLPFFIPSRIFLIALKIKAFPLFTAPLVYEWYTQAKPSFIPI